MLRLFVLSISVLFQITASAKGGFETSISVECYANKKFTIENFVTSVEIEIKKTDMNKDPSNPPRWFTSQTIQVKNGGQTNNASLLMNKKNQIAFSYVEPNENESTNTVLYLFELDIDKLEIKKTSISIFSNKSNSTSNSTFYCKKLP